MNTDIPYNDGVLSITFTARPAGLAVAGEIDESTYCAFVQALECYAKNIDTLHLDLSGLQYCDVAGLRAMVAVTSARGPSTPTRLVLHAVPRQLRNTLRILGWDALPGVSVKDQEGDSTP